MSESKIDLNEVANNSNLSLSITSAQEENPHDACIRRIKDIVLFVIATLFIVAAFIFCGYMLFSSSSTPDDKKWSMTIASGIISALLGYLTGKNIN
jgi:hypothetical protein